MRELIDYKRRLLSLKSLTLVSGKAKPYPLEMEKTAKDKIKSKINEIEAAINDGDYALDENIKMVKSNMESAYSNLSSQIQKTNVSLVMNFEKNKCLFPKGIILLNF